MSENNDKKIRFGNERFGGSYRPGEFELNLPDDLTYEEFEEMFHQRMGALYKLGRELNPFDDYDEEKEAKKEKLRPLSIRVKSHTKEFFKNHSILSAREVLELYENYNKGSEAFINSLLDEEKELEQELSEIQEKLHNAKLFKEKLTKLNVKDNKKSDEEIMASLSEEYADSQIKAVSSSDEIISDIELYSTQKIVVRDCEILEIVASNDVIPVVYYFSYKSSEDDMIKALAEIKQYCKSNEIEYVSQDDE